MINPVVHIREAEFSDLSIVTTLYQDLHEKDLPASESELLAAWDEIISDARTHLFILFTDGDAVSTCILSIIPNLSRGARPYGLIENVVTKKGYRNQGHAGRLLAHALGFAWEKRCYKVMLMTGRNEDFVHRLYYNAGFVKGEKEGLVAHNPAVM